MTRDADVLIIGGGAIGICCAHHLIEQGRDVTLVEMGEIGSGSSYGNAGLVFPEHSIPLAAPGCAGRSDRAAARDPACRRAP